MKILIVDENSAMIGSLLPLLKNTPGNEVRAANSGEKALEAAAQWQGVDLLITEVFMEPMNGFTLRNKMRNRFGTKTIFFSKHDLTDYAEHVEDAATLRKPVKGNELFAAIAKTFAPAPQAPVEAKAATRSEPPAPAAQPRPPPRNLRLLRSLLLLRSSRPFLRRRKRKLLLRLFHPSLRQTRPRLRPRWQVPPRPNHSHR